MFFVFRIRVQAAVLTVCTMTSVEEKAPTSGAKKDLVTGPVFIGYGTKHIICSNGWVTQTKTTESKGLFSSKLLPVTSGCELVQAASNSKQQSLKQLQPKPPEAKNTYISVTQLPTYPGHTVQQIVGNNRQSTTLQSQLVVSETKNIALLPKSSVQLSRPNYSLDLKVLMPEKSSAVTTVPANSSSVAVSVVPDNISHFELIPVNATLFMGASKPSNSASGLTVNKGFHQLDLVGENKTLPKNSTRLVNISRQGIVNGNQVTAQQNAGRGLNVNIGDGDESRTSEDMASDDALAAQNNNSLDAEDSLETKKTAARRKLNAVLQSAVENQPVIKAQKVLNIGKSLEPKFSNLMSGRIMLKPANISKRLPGQAVTLNERPNGMKVRIENAKIVKVAECENSSFRIPSSAMQNIGVDVAQLRCADDIFRKGESPHLIIPPLRNDKEIREVMVETSTDPFSSRGMACASSAAGGQTYVFEPLSISADTLVPVTGTSGLRERQNLKEIELMCKRQEQAQDIQDKEPNSGKESATSSSGAMVLRCFLCPYYHTKQTKIAKHWIQVHLTQRPYVCPYCERNYTTSYEAQLHVHKMHRGEKLTIAIKNSAHFASNLAYELVHSENAEEPNADGEAVEADQPRYIHTNVLTFSCKKCDFRCTSALDLKAHLRSVHVRYKPHFCMYCTDQKRSFSCDFDLKQHIRRFHPERVPPGGRTFSESVIPSVAADIDWASTYEAIPISGKVIFQCRSCTFRSFSPDSAWKHVLTTHEWPKEVKCPLCAQLFQLSSVDRQNCSASCTHCQGKMSLGPNNSNVARLPEKGVPVFVCTPCEYKTMGKGSMNRHLKYNHTKCRPYACAYCNYSAVERPKIKSHIVHVHPDMEIDIRERTESSDAYRSVLSDLFKTIVKLEYTTDIPVSDMVAMDKERNGGKRALEEDSDSDCSSNNVLPKRQRLDLVPSDSLNFATNRSTKLSVQAQERERKVTEGPHFLCMICGYKCIDRSCMSRHIKYMHLPTRPHSCPYCMYSNVEKTKVRLHVKANHPSLQRCVKTDKRILEQLSYEAKQYYIRVDAKGKFTIVHV